VPSIKVSPHNSQYNNKIRTATRLNLAALFEVFELTIQKGLEAQESGWVGYLPNGHTWAT